MDKPLTEAELDAKILAEAAIPMRGFEPGATILRDPGRPKSRARAKQTKHAEPWEKRHAEYMRKRGGPLW